MENPEEVLQTLDEFTKLKPKDIPKELEDYLSYVAKTGDPVYQWSLVKSLFREKLLNVITDFYEGCPSVDLPPCPNVDTFNYETMKDRLIERLELFASAPFTVQRLCELLTSPKKQYSRADKFMRAVEKNIMVVSTREPGQIRRIDSGQPELVNGVADTTGAENEPSRVNLGLGLGETIGSSATSTTSFLNTEGSVQVIFEDGSLDKNHSPTKSYEESYEDGVPRRASAWFRERVESPDKLSPFGSQVHSHVTTRTSEENDVDVGNQLAEKYHGPVVDRGIVEEDDDDIDDDYIEPTRNVANFHSQEPSPTLLGLESAEDYCCPPSPDEENSETSVAVSTIAEETSNSIPDTSVLEEGETPQKATTLPAESDKDVPTSSDSESKTSDDKTDKAEPASPSLKVTNVEEKSQNSTAVGTTDESTTPVSTTTCEEAPVTESENDKLPNTDADNADMEADGMDVNSTGDGNEAASLETVVFESSKGEVENIEEITMSKRKSPEPIVEEPVEPETSAVTTADEGAKESPEPIVDADSTIKEVESISIKESEPLEAETIEMSILEGLEPIVSEESSDAIAAEVPSVEEDVGLSTSEPLREASSETVSDEPTKKTEVQDEAEAVPELPAEVSEPLKTETVPEVPAKETSESGPSIEEERDREMMIQNERVESVIQENVEQAPLQEEILMQQIFVPHEIPMDEKTSECEPEAMEVDENSQTVEEPMDQEDNSPTIS